MWPEFLHTLQLSILFKVFFPNSSGQCQGHILPTHDWRLVSSCPTNLADKWNKMKKIANLKLIDNVEQSVFEWFTRMLSSEMAYYIFCAQATSSLCCCLTVFQYELNPANSSWLNFGKHTPLVNAMCSNSLCWCFTSIMQFRDGV